jgi:hypothetical protein
MALPERFSIKDAAERLDQSESYVEEMVRTLQFTHIIVIDENTGSKPLTRHLYFDRKLWLEHHGKKLTIDPKTSEKAMRKQIESYNKEWKNKGLNFDPAQLMKGAEHTFGQTHLAIGPNEVAYLWDPSKAEYQRPMGSRLQIPRLALEAAKQKHGQRKEKKSTALASQSELGRARPPQIQPDCIYTVKEAVTLLERTVNHIYRLIDEGRITVQRVGNGPRARIQITGKELLRFRDGSPE